MDRECISWIIIGHFSQHYKNKCSLQKGNKCNKNKDIVRFKLKETVSVLTPCFHGLGWNSSVELAAKTSFTFFKCRKTKL